jgi:dihydrofolate reductase
MPPEHITLLAAVDRNNAIGKGNTLPWRHRCDMKLFKETTTGNTVVMGSKTYESMGCKPLPNRRNIVITSDPSKFDQHDEVFFVTSIAEALEHEIVGHLFVIGGANIYKQFLTYATNIVLSKLDLEVEGADTFFPTFDDSEELWDIVIVRHPAGETHPSDVAFDQYIYRRRKP